MENTIPENFYSVVDNLTSPSERRKIINDGCIFNHNMWLQYFKQYTSKEWLNENKSKRTSVHHSLRLTIQGSTIDCIENGFYRLLDGTNIKIDKEELEKDVKLTKLYRDAPAIPNQVNEEDTKISLFDWDCLEVGLWLKEKGYNPIVLNMANAKNPGGGYKSGSGAQEENLHRRSNFYQALEDPKQIQGKNGGGYNYPIPESGAIYSPSIFIFRKSEARGYEFMAVPRKMAFVTCAALNKPQLKHENNKPPRMVNKCEVIMRNKIRTMLAIGLENNHDSIVLSAFGCGAFSCPAYHVAELFKEALNGEFKNKYKQVVFAIFDDHNSKKVNEEGNVIPFAKTFNVEIEKTIHLENY